MAGPDTARRVAGLVEGDDGAWRCEWCRATPEYRRYHDTEWGFPVTDDTRLFEKICLEGFQAGLAWITILNKRDAFRRAFAGFDPERVACFDEADVSRLVTDAGIVRHRGKIESTINNARRALGLRAEFGSIDAFVWGFEPKKSSRPRRITHAALLARGVAPEAVALSEALRTRGWTFVGPTTMYALMQAMGLVNDHLEGCHVRAEALQRRAMLKDRARATASVRPGNG